MKRVVWRQDAGQCAFVAPDGRRCSEKAFLEFHHVHAHAFGGPPTVGNISLRCRLCRARHKRHYAECRIMPSAIFRLGDVTVASVGDAA